MGGNFAQTQSSELNLDTFKIFSKLNLLKKPTQTNKQTKSRTNLACILLCNSHVLPLQFHLSSRGLGRCTFGARYLFDQLYVCCPLFRVDLLSARKSLHQSERRTHRLLQA